MGTGTQPGEIVRVELKGRIDSNNAAEREKEILEQIRGRETLPLELCASGLTYISSAGLRVLLHIKKTVPELRITDVTNEVYEILEMTGFTQMMTVEKAYRSVSVEGCEEIGRGANGTLYRIDTDNVVKVYNNADALDEIRHETDVARKALILGIPTAIPYDVVRVGDHYGSVFELLNARSFSEILLKEPDKFDWCVDEYVKMLHKIHGTLVPAGDLPDFRETALGWTDFLKDYLPGPVWDKLRALVEAVPHDDHMIHGDFHTKNLELQGDEVLLIDMDTLSVGHPIFELGSMYNGFVGYYEYDHEEIKKFQGYDFETGRRFWNSALAAYLRTEDPDRLREVEDKARILGYARMIRRLIRRGGLDTEKGKIDFWTRELTELVDRTDSLLFTADAPAEELDIEAVRENLPKVLAYVDEKLNSVGCPAKAQMQIALAVEEIFINISEYAYAPDKGMATVRVEVSEKPICVKIIFTDHGKPYDPVAREDPDVTLPAHARGVGGLGIFLVKKTMDDVNYEYKDGQNILTLKKNL